MKISSLHDDLLWPKVSHECGLGEFVASGMRAPIADRSPLARTTQFGADHDALDFNQMAATGGGYEQYCSVVAKGLASGYETVVGAIFGRHTATPPRIADGGSAMEVSVQDSLRRYQDGFASLNWVQRGDDFAHSNGSAVNLVVGIEGMDYVQNIEQVSELAAGGVRVFAFQYNKDNGLASATSGLTPFGREALNVVLRSSGVVDLAHSAPAVRDAILNFAGENGRGHQVSYTHGGVLDNAPPQSAERFPERFLRADEVQRLVKIGGIFGVTPALPFYPSLDAAADCIARLSDTFGGCRNIAIGTDFGGLWDGLLFPEIRCAADVPRLGDVLAERHGFTDEQISMILRTNVTDWLRRALADTV